MNHGSNILIDCLDELNIWLRDKTLFVDLAIIGRFAFYLSGFQQLATLDITIRI